MEERLENIEKEIETVKSRNRRVEADKAWETSWFRMFSLGIITYGVAAVILFLIRAENVLLTAFVPAAGFMLSVQTLPTIKRWWRKRFLKNIRD